MHQPNTAYQNQHQIFKLFQVISTKIERISYWILGV